VLRIPKREPVALRCQTPHKFFPRSCGCVGETRPSPTHSLPQAALTERIPPLDEASYAGNLAEDVPTLAAAAAPVHAPADLLGDLLSPASAPDSVPGGVAATGGPHAAVASAGPRDMLSDLDDLLSGAAQAPVADPIAPAADGHPPFTAWSNAEDGVDIVFACSASSPGTTNVLATYTNRGATPVESFQVLAAVPKSMTITMEAQLGGWRLVPHAGNTLTQRMRCVNNAHGSKPLAMRLKVTYEVSGVAREHLTVVSAFPPGL
jgi:hypothetical protein